MRVAIVFNQPVQSDPREFWLAKSAGTRLPSDFRDPSEQGVVDEAQAIESHLHRAGHDCMLYAAEDAPGLVAFLSHERPDVIFNCCESLRGDAALEMAAAGVYDLLGISYTGSPALTLGMALHKPIAKAVFRARGIPTPASAVLRPGALPNGIPRLRYPLIVKPAREDGGAGIDDRSVVAGEAALRRRIEFVWQEFRQPALVEEFIDGREIYAGLLAVSAGTFEMLPLGEIDFTGLPAEHPRIVGYEAKWMEDSVEYGGTPARYPAALPSGLADRVRRVAFEAARAVGLRDYGRVDCRVGRDGEVFVLEANPNPDISAGSGFMRAARAAGRTDSDVILNILDAAIARVDPRR